MLLARKNYFEVIKYLNLNAIARKNDWLMYMIHENSIEKR